MSTIPVSLVSTYVCDLKASRLWRTFDQLVGGYTVRFADSARIILAKEGKAAARTYEATASEQAALAAVTPDPWARYLSKVWLTTVPAGGEFQAQADAIEVPNRVFSEAAYAWLSGNGPIRARDIAESGRYYIANQIRKGMAAGESTRQIAARVAYYYYAQRIPRSNRIARTEVHSAANLGSITAARQTPRPKLKMWLATPDDRTRDHHAEAHGQEVPLNEPFIVMGEQLDYPGDTDLGASPENIINCRCSMKYIALKP